MEKKSISQSPERGIVRSNYFNRRPFMNAWVRLFKMANPARGLFKFNLDKSVLRIMRCRAIVVQHWE